MRPATRPRPCDAALLTAIVVAVGCRHPAPLPVPVAPTSADATQFDADAASDVGPTVDTPVDTAATTAPPGPWASAWTDPSAIARLVTNCDFHPPASENSDDGDPLECATSIEQQSCSYDPCHEDVDLPCRRVCGRTCTSCDTRCRGACGRCRAACHDDACVLACATSCGQCLQTCLTEKDRCLTAGCAARYGACFRRSVDHFRNGPCLAACTRCSAACEGGDRMGPCLSRCLGRTRACTAEEVNHCAWDGPSYGAPDPAEDGDAGAP